MEEKTGVVDGQLASTGRTEDDAVVQGPIEVKLCGGQAFGIAQLMAGDAIEWAREHAKIQAKTLRVQKSDLDDKTALADAVESLLMELPEEMVDSFFRFAKDLAPQRAEIMRTTPIAELIAAMRKVFRVGNPFFGLASE